MGAKTPEQVIELLEDAFRAKDVEAIAELYEDDAIFANPPAWTAVGRAEIADRVREMFQTTTSLVTDYDPPMKSVMIGDYAFVHYTSRTRVSLPDGDEHEMSTRTTVVAHRGADGTWRFILDHNSAP